MTAARSNCYAVAITVTGETAVEAIEFLFDQLDSLGTEIGLMHNLGDGYTRIVGYFFHSPDISQFDLKMQLALAAHNLGKDVIVSIEEKTIEPADWLQEWKKHWRTEGVGRFVIAPAWEMVEENTDEIVIRIDPGMAFGTGTHETTRLCLKAIDENYLPEMSFLDVGTGTGILAIAAAMSQGATPSPILACDVDEDAVRIARENAEVNGVADKIEFTARPLSSSAPIFDFTCANLRLDTIKALLPLLLEKSRRVLVLSGILADQKAAIENELRKHGVKNHDIQTDGEWISVIVIP